jgi:hypothetical protein
MLTCDFESPEYVAGENVTAKSSLVVMTLMRGAWQGCLHEATQVCSIWKGHRRKLHPDWTKRGFVYGENAKEICWVARLHHVASWSSWLGAERLAHGILRLIETLRLRRGQ